MHCKYTFILDVDGVMTTGQFLYSLKGKIYKIFGPHDNDGIKLISPFVNILFVTADKRGYEISQKRIVEDMGQKLLLLSETQRLPYIKEHYDLDSVIYMGDGYFDAKILREVYYGIAPKSARVEAKNSANYITSSNGGEGAVLDASLHLIDKFNFNIKELND